MASNDESSSDDENNSFLSKESIIRPDYCEECCENFDRNVEKCSCKMSPSPDNNDQETSKCPKRGPKPLKCLNQV